METHLFFVLATPPAANYTGRFLNVNSVLHSRGYFLFLIGLFFFFFFLGRCDGILITGRVHFDAPLHFPRSAWRPDLYLESDQLLIGIFQFFFSFE